VPITFGAGTVLLFTTADVIYVHWLFPHAEQLYMPAAMVGLVLMVYAMPIAQVMFPKVARSAALAGRSHAMALALVATGAGAAAGALACTVLPALPLRLVYFSKPEFWAAAPLVPWFAWALLPLTLANVLINNLLAREQFRVVPWVVAVGALYLGVLFGVRGWLPTLEPLTAFRCLLSLTGGCGLLLLAIAAHFTPRESVGADK
jgi:O-antigen/teichoic acid export membrane protein